MNLKRRDFLKAGSLGAGGLLLTQFVNQLEAAPKAKPARVLFFVQIWLDFQQPVQLATCTFQQLPSHLLCVWRLVRPRLQRWPLPIKKIK